MKSRLLIAALVLFHVLLLIGQMIAPYDPAEQRRDLAYLPPANVRLIDANGEWHLWPFVYRMTERPDEFGVFVEDTSQRFPLQLFVRGAEYKLLGLTASNIHLFGVAPDARIAVLGNDQFGRDLFSRWLIGAQISVAAGLFASLLTVAVGSLLGLLAGYCGGWVDTALMRLSDVALALPWLYLLFAVRAFLPLSMSPTVALLMIVGILGLIGWPRTARLVRGITLSARSESYVLAARGFGASPAYLIRRHLLPESLPTVLTVAAVLIPQYVLAEIALSFVGLGVGEPEPSWGNLLGSLQQYHVVVAHPWMLLPIPALILLLHSYFSFSEYLEKRLESRSN